MKILKNQFFVSYLCLALFFGLILVIKSFIQLSPWSIMVVFFGVLLIPGFSLSRIFKLSEKNVLEQLFMYLVIGFAFNLLFSFCAMFLGQNITFITNLYLALLIVLFFAAFSFDLLVYRKNKEQLVVRLAYDKKKIFNLVNLGYVFIFILAILMLNTVLVQGSLFKGGDPAFHLSLLRKISDGQAITPTNIGFTKSATLQIAYGFPAWHVFMAILAKVGHGNIFELWRSISFPLGIFSLIVWYALFQKVFRNRFVSFTGLAFLVIFVYNWTVSRLFLCLPIPDTFNNMILFPLTFLLVLKYIFEKETNYKVLVVTAVLAVMMAMIHMTQYFYFLMLLGLTGICWLLLEWKNQEYKPVLVRFGWALFATCFIFVPFLVLLQIKSNIIGALLTARGSQMVHYEDLEYRNFNSYILYAKYAYVFSPLVLLYLRKQRQLVFLIALLIISPLVYFEPVALFLWRHLEFIFVDRFFNSVFWHYLALGFIIGAIILLIDQFFSWIKIKLNKVYQYVIDALFVFLTIFFAWSQIKSHTFYELIFSDKVDKWLSGHFFWVFVPLLIICLIVVALQFKKPKIADLFSLLEPKNGLIVSCLVLALLTTFISTTYEPLWKNARKTVTKNMFFRPTNTSEYEMNTLKGLGGVKMGEFIDTQIPHKSIFLVPGSTVYTFPVMFDQYMPAYARTLSLTNYSLVYEKSVSFEDKLKSAANSKAEYILLYAPEKQGNDFFISYPQYFQPVFQEKGKAIIYKVNRVDLVKEVNK